MRIFLILISFLAFSLNAVAASTQSFFQAPAPTKVVATTPEDDAAITQTLKKIIRNSPTIAKFNIDVDTKQGVVVLNGVVDSDTQADRLVAHAQSIIGVADVDATHLKVKDGKQPFADMITTAKIKGLLVREDLFGEKDVASINTSIETKDGIVYLSGHVDNKTQINNAIEIIKKNIPELKGVEYSVVMIKT
ncbi:MAG TPA: BON domain-containing protein [Gammaproteobacteria bacterium]|jgi:osmotically-inducible protein OsmY|nr:BON domain-containing protein [Gammaproteobacteria bacterium]